MSEQAIVWFRRDLRLRDNPAWAAASNEARLISALYVLDPVLLEVAGPIRRNLLFAHLVALDEMLRRKGGRLRVHRGRPADVVPRLARRLGVQTVYANADVTPYSRRRDEAVRDRLTGTMQCWWGGLVHPPGSVRAGTGHTPRVFTSFFRTWSGLDPAPEPEPEPEPEPDRVRVDGDPGEGLPSVEGTLFQAGGEEAAMDRLLNFNERVNGYAKERDVPASEGTSFLSADLHFGTLGPRTALTVIGSGNPGRAAFVRQLAWRDWYAHLLWEEPDLVSHAMRRDLDRIAWVNDPDDVAAWRDGLTGYPLVDAGMRQLASTGWMHNRVRMVTASFLVKDLLVDWRIGERWFRRLLVDGDVSQNAGNWQWVAGTGPDAAPYFRVFNPVRQSEKFDPAGDYIRRFVPELVGLPDRWVHAPWTAPSEALAAVGVILGESYPHPIIEHSWARDRALGAYRAATGRAH
jgi:deoxyribodipyrimidine photo-lyase